MFWDGIRGMYVSVQGTPAHASAEARLDKTGESSLGSSEPGRTETEQTNVGQESERGAPYLGAAVCQDSWMN